MSLDKLYMSSAVHIFKSKIKPLLLEQRKKGQGHKYNKDILKEAKTMMMYIHCIQNTEFAAATAHNITQELPPGQESNKEGQKLLPPELHPEVPSSAQPLSAPSRLREDTVTQVLLGPCRGAVEGAQPWGHKFSL